MEDGLTRWTWKLPRRSPPTARVQWRRVPGFPSTWVTNYGDVWDAGTPWSEPRKRSLRPQTDQHGYRMALILTRIGFQAFGVHRIVMLAFAGPPPIGMVIDHIDGDKSNNCLANLQYVTRGENTRLYFSRRKAAGLPALVNGRRQKEAA